MPRRPSGRQPKPQAGSDVAICPQCGHLFRVVPGGVCPNCSYPLIAVLDRRTVPLHRLPEADGGQSRRAS